MERKAMARWSSPSSSIRQRFNGLISAGHDGLPSLRLLFAFPVLLLLAGILLVGFAVDGNSSGVFYNQVHSGKDPALIAGKPETIRSDEWNVVTVWTISQLQQGLPARNRTFPGGMDAQLPFALPHAQASIVLEPQLWGFLFLDANHAFAWQWWLPGLVLIACAYALMVSLMPRRPLVAAALAVGYFFSPFYQWWYTSSTIWTAAWGVAAATAVVWAVRSPSLRVRIGWAIPIAALTVVMASGIYAPFMIPVIIVVALFAIGMVVGEARSGTPLRVVLLRLVPLAIGAAAAAAVMLVWLRSISSVVDQFLSTVYPGTRLTPTGATPPVALARTIGSSFSQSLLDSGGFLGTNSSEASSYFLLGTFLIPAAIWVTIRRLRRHQQLPWAVFAIVVSLLIFLAFMYVPGWDSLAHLMFLDRSTGDRLRIGVGLASFLLVGTIASELNREDIAPPRSVAWVGAGLFGASQLAIAAAILKVQGASSLWGDAPEWWLFALLSCAAIFLFARRHLGWGVAAFLVVSVASSLAVNPVYVGVLDLRKTQLSRDVVAANNAHAATWVGIGDPLMTATLLESGVRAFNGTQGAPSRTMWTQIDPDGRYATNWNRLGAVIWALAPGEPVVSNPAPDVIQPTFDACSTFARKHVGWVLSDKRVMSPCLRIERTIRLPHSVASIYRVVPSS
jgi:hypothetical protein